MFGKNRSFIIRRAAATELRSHSSLILSLLTVGILFISAIVFGSVLYTGHLAYAAYIKATPSSTGPTVNNPNLKVEKIFPGGLQIPTSMAFLGLMISWF